MQNKKLYYRGRFEALSDEEKKTRRKLRYLSALRLIAFISLLIGVFIAVPQNIYIGFIVIFLSIIAFISLIKIYQRNNESHLHLKALIRLNQEELKALDHNYSGFDSGNEYADLNHPYSYDIDLFGEGSLFQYINRTVTSRGKKKLASWLINETLDTKIIINRQSAVSELTGVNELMQDFRASGTLWPDTEEDIELLVKWLNKPVFYLESKFYLILAVVLPGITISAMLISIFFIDFINLAMILFFAQLLLTGFRMKHTSIEHALIGKRLDVLKKYSHILGHIEKGNFKGEKLKGISESLFNGWFSAAQSIKHLSGIVSAFDNRLNFLAAIFLEGFFLWDIHCMIRLEKWKRKQGKHLEEWINAIAEFDTLVSLATYSFNHPDNSYPLFSKEVILDVVDMGHILIPPQARICNDFKLVRKGDFVIITGANMSGKSTFLRSVATNMILAMTGASVCAKSFVYQPMLLFSSMRTTDSLNKNESYFYAELKRLKEMLDILKSGNPIFIILDEILKGTNSTDKQKGSKAVLNQILQNKGSGIIATHDLELTKTENDYPDIIHNMCFEIDIDHAKITFDYKLLNGITSKMNASLLMKQMGIIIE
jgi:DNA mismatch repair ATPase MutS